MSLISGKNMHSTSQEEQFTLSPVAKWVKAAMIVSVASTIAF